MSSSNKKAADRTAVAAAMRAEQAKREARRRILTIGGVALVMILIVGGAVLFSVVKNNKDNSKIGAAATATAAGTYGVVMGSDSATHKVIIYEDFLCPFCRELEESTRDFLRENAAKGKVQVEYRPIDLLTQTTYSARAMNAWAQVLANASPADALKLHDLFYENQPYEQNADQTTDSDIAALVQKAVGNNSKVMASLKTTDNAFFASASQVMADKGIDSTPTVFIDGHELTGMSVQQIVDAIEKAVG